MIIREQHGTQNGQNCTQNLNSNNRCYKCIFFHTFCHGRSHRKSDYSKTHHLLLVIVIIWVHHVWKNASIQLCFLKLHLFSYFYYLHSENVPIYLWTFKFFQFFFLFLIFLFYFILYFFLPLSFCFYLLHYFDKQN